MIAHHGYLFLAIVCFAEAIGLPVPAALADWISPGATSDQVGVVAQQCDLGTVGQVQLGQDVIGEIGLEI